MYLAELHDDIPRLVLEQLYYISPNSLPSVARVSRRIHGLTIPFIYRSICLQWNAENLSEKLQLTQSLLDHLNEPSSHLPSLIRQITIPDFSALDTEQLQDLIDLLPKLQRLEEFSWIDHSYRAYGNVPRKLMQALEEHTPSARLIVSGTLPFHSLPTEGVDDIIPETHRLSSPLLHALSCELPNDPGKLGKASLFNILKSCPNLKVLKVETQSGGCLSYEDDPMLEEFLDPTPEDCLPQLEELSLRESPFCLEDLVLWGQKGGWENLKSLKIDDSEDLKAFVGRVPKLEVLHLRDGWPAESTLFELGHCCLKELWIDGSEMEYPFAMIEKHGSRLENLRIHVMEPYDPGRRADVSIADIARLNQLCPGLKELEIDINREGEWPYEYLRALAQFPNVTRLKLLAEGQRGSGVPVKPILDKDAGTHLFSFLRENKVGRQLQRLEIQRRGMRPPGFGYPASVVLMEEDYMAVFICYMHQNETIVEEFDHEMS